MSGAFEESPRKRVLLVEDNLDNRSVYRLILEYGGYDVIEAGTGTEALEFARAERPHLILMDISIPVVDGWEVTRRLKAGRETRDIPILALTAHAMATDRLKAEEVGCDGFLPKPVGPRQVLAEVDARLG